MFRRNKSKTKAIGPAPPFPTPRGLDGEGCQIIFGHNTNAQKVLMQFSAAASRLIFTPEEAEDVAAKLQYYAKAARGEKVA